MQTQPRTRVGTRGSRPLIRSIWFADLRGRAGPFVPSVPASVAEMARRIRRWQPGGDLPWGSGKTTVLRLIEQELTRLSTPESTILIVPGDLHRGRSQRSARLACASGSGYSPPRRSKPAFHPAQTTMTFSSLDLTRPLAQAQELTVLGGAGRVCGRRVGAGRLRPAPRQARHPTRWRLDWSAAEGRRRFALGAGFRPRPRSKVGGVLSRW